MKQNQLGVFQITSIIIWRITETKASGRLIILHSESPGLFEVHYHVSAKLAWDFLLLVLSSKTKQKIRLSSKCLKKICIEQIVNSADLKATCFRQRWAW